MREHLRATLVDVGILPARAERLARIERWLDDLLAGQPPDGAHLVRTFAIWHVLRRTRRRARNDDASTGADSAARTRIRVAVELLGWLDDHQRDLAATTQADIERWIVEYPTRAHHAGAFLAWCRQHGLTGDLHIPTPSRSQPAQTMTDQQRWQLLKHCLQDETLSDADRVAGVLVLLYGQPLSRLVSLDTRSVCTAAADGSTSGSTPAKCGFRMTLVFSWGGSVQMPAPGQSALPGADGCFQTSDLANTYARLRSEHVSAASVSITDPPATVHSSLSPPSYPLPSPPACSAYTSGPPSNGPNTRKLTRPPISLPESASSPRDVSLVDQ